MRLSLSHSVRFVLRVSCAHALQTHPFIQVKPSYSHFETIKALGEGNYSQVDLVRHLETGERFALKLIDKIKASRLARRHANLRKEIEMERSALRRLTHPHVVQLVHTWQDATNLYFLQEFCPNGELWSLLRYTDFRMVALDVSRTRTYLKQLASALAYLKRNGIVHRDVKPENVMLTDGGRTAKLIDFGTARDVVEDALARVFVLKKKRIKLGDDDDENAVHAQKKRKETHFVGTPECMAPEAVHGQVASYACDAWAFGCTLYQLLLGRLPFKAASPYLTFLRIDALAYDVPQRAREYAPLGFDLVDALLKIDPKERLSIEDVEAHEFFASRIEDPRVLSLRRACIECIGDTLLTAQLKAQTKKRKKRPMEPSKRFAELLRNRREICDLDEAAKHELMQYVQQRGGLVDNDVLSLFFASLKRPLESVSPSSRVFHRLTSEGTYLGYTSDDQTEFHTAFAFAQMHFTSTSTADGVRAFGVALAAVRPVLKVVVLTGVFDAALVDAFVSSLTNAVPCMLCFRREFTLQRQSSFWVQGVLLSFFSASDQLTENALLIGKLSARHSIVISSMPFDAVERECMLHNVKMVVDAHADATSRKFVRIAETDRQDQFQDGISVVSTSACRLFRVSGHDVVSDAYANAFELPTWISLDASGDDQKMKPPQESDDDSSDFDSN